ncbi:MAG: hypothetical protein JWR16_3023 [Nevskia sp.]|nr:hypothetical protein [Nevskia sp.]
MGILVIRVRRHARLLAMSTVVFVLAGCGWLNRSKVSCSDDGTKDLVRQLFADAMLQQPVVGRKGEDVKSKVQALKVVLNAIRTDSIDDRLHKVSCKAEMTVSLPRPATNAQWVSAMDATMNENGYRWDASGVTGPISYTSQPTDDGKQQYVEMTGQEELAVLASSLMTGQSLYGKNNDAATSALTTTSPSQESSKVVEIAGVLSCGNVTCSFGRDNQVYEVGLGDAVDLQIAAACGEGLCKLKAEVSDGAIDWVISAVKISQ